MLDENLPNFQFRAGSENPSSSVVYFTQNGAEPSPAYLFKRADPVSQPACRGKYAAALVDPYHEDVIYGEVVASPEWQQPTLSAAELRAQGPVAAPPVPLVPDSFTVQLYNPDQMVAFKMVTGGWGKSDTWEFEMPTQSFKLPSTSELDRQQDAAPASGITPKVMFRWKKDGRLTKDMTCYMAGRSLGRHKSKEPDITIALFKQGRDSTVTIYEPNLQRVDVEDRKGLDIVLLLGAEVIRDLYLVPRQDLFNISAPESGVTAAMPNGSARKNSCPMPPGPASGPSGAMMSGALGPSSAARPNGALGMPSSLAATAAAPGKIDDPETQRLKAMVEREERELAERERKERERRDKAEQERIKRMLEEEENERRRREAEIASETERLRRMYGTEGQDLPSSRPALPPRPGVGAASPPPVGSGPARPLSAGPGAAASYYNTNNSNAGSGAGTWWTGPRPGPAQYPQQPGSGSFLGSGGGSYGYGQNPAASTSGFFNGRERRDNDRRRMQKKRSVHF